MEQNVKVNVNMHHIARWQPQTGSNFYVECLCQRRNISTNLDWRRHRLEWKCKKKQGEK